MSASAWGCAPAWSPCSARSGRREAHWRHGRRGPGRRPIRVGGEQGGNAGHGGRGGISLRWRDIGGVAGLDGDGGISSTTACSVGQWRRRKAPVASEW
jgi:hypothetical protein